MDARPAPTATAPGGEDVWERWLPAWHVYHVGVVVVTAVLAFAGHQVDAAELPIVVAGLAILLGAYWAVWLRQNVWSSRLTTRIGYAILLLAVFAILMSIAPAFTFLQFTLYPQLFFCLPNRWAIPAGLSIGLILALDALVDAGGDAAAAGPEMVLHLASAVAFTMLSAWIGAIIVQSAERQELLTELAATRAELATAEREAGVADERSRLSREIHDTLAQGFASVVTHLEAADAVLDTDPGRARGHMHAATDVARASLDEARGLVWALRPPVLADGGLPAALGRVVARAPGAELTISGEPRPLDPDVEVTVLRAAQEALANARRHAAAGSVAVTLTYFDDTVALDVIDDGRGFDPAAVAEPGPAGGHGLRGMRERAERLHGTLAVESAPGEGTAIALSLPAGVLPGSATVPGSAAVAPDARRASIAG